MCFYITFYFSCSSYCEMMRRRIYKGTLVASTNPLRRILSKRLIVEVLYNFRHGIVIEKVIDVRTSIEQ